MFKHFKWFVFALFLALPLSAFALTGYSGESVVLSKDKVVNSNYYSAGNMIEIYGTVNGDIFVAGETIIIDSENINGDIFVAGSSVTIKGKVNGSIRAAGENIDVSGVVERNVMMAGKSFRLNSDSKIMGHLTFWGQALSVSGEVGRLEGAMERVNLSGTVVNDVDIYISSTPEAAPIRLEDSSSIGGTLYYQALREVELNENASIGNVGFNKIVEKAKSSFDRGNIFGMIVKFFGMVVVGMVIVHLWPKFFTKGYEVAKKRPFMTGLKGILLLIVTPIACVLVAITVIGLPLSFLVMGLWVMGLYLASVLAAWILGKAIKDKWLAKYKWSPLGTISFGVLVYILVGKIPLVGFLIVLVLYLLAWGSFVDLFKFKKENK